MIKKLKILNMYLFIFCCTLSGLYSDELLFREPEVKPSDAFSMIGDSRTQYIFLPGNPSADWEDEPYLGQYRSACSGGKTGIQNAGIAGSTASDWISILRDGKLKPESLHERVVVLVGGNDVLRHIHKWKGAYSWNITEREEILDAIHSDVKEIVRILRSWNKSVIVQTHFYANPKVKKASTKAVNQGVTGLNLRLYESYYPKDDGKSYDSEVSLAFVKPEFDSKLFFDQVHLNHFGFQFHSYFLNLELQKRCWW
ncbi:MAG TPA: SGNH/GDSL hydrolase family protein [Leptospiraceae bacterium]|nr:SGNH/GDSL hydrolase family protein [Leptospiraceae bacterium]HMY68020.1 SGNH/GDSL hydrolase family protein [Leptospiraceae bacterium]HNF26230.1 SGNH/GDSL hydrolase family protein [Leptospiraceae bacterium]HNM02922.1 SGNH/GDSL hydrolase family protein [Leptospiraceae bacterium]HNN03847.1 SGNH/GDSL hydrolase family protein [Leptospiraceae bacterium]